MPMNGNASLRKSRAPVGDWRKFGKSANPYAEFQVNNNAQLQIPSHDKQKIKRRLSVKMDGAVPDFSQMPALPAAALQMVSEEQEREDQPQQPKPVSKTKNSGDKSSFAAPLAEPMLDARRFVTQRLQDAKASEVDSFASRLAALEERVDEDIKNNVNKSYEKILIVSNDLSSTEVELKSLKGTLTTLLDITGQMKETAELRVSAEKISTLGPARDRSSVAILQQRWVSELDSLFRHVEGAQKMLSATPGRHVLAESGRWQELNAATWRPLHPAHIFVLNDHVLVAQAKARGKLLAQQCWPIQEVGLQDVADSLSFKIGSASYVYQTDRREEQKKIVRAVKKAQAQIRDNSEQEQLRQRQLRDSMSILSASDRSGKRSSSLLQDLSARIQTRNSIEDSSLVRSLRDIDNMIDEIDIRIAHHRFAEAVELQQDCGDEILRKKKEFDGGQQEAIVLLDVLQMKFDQRRNQLEAALVFELGDELSSPQDVGDFIMLLKHLGSTNAAKENFLLARSNLIGRLIGEVEFEGDLPDYLAQVSIIRFQIIKATAGLYKEMFPEPEYSSDIIKWCTEEVKKHADMLKKQLFDVKQDSPIHKTCLEITRKQIADLRSSGLDVEFLVW